MFERFGDLPLHVLVIHLAVVLLPASALVAIVFAVMPRWRRLLRWPTLLLGIGSAVVAFVAKESGEAFVAAKPALAQLVREHEERGDLLFWYSIGFAFITILGALWLTGRSALASGRGARTGARRPVELVVSAGLVVMSVLMLWQTVRTGDAGARAVWEGTFSS
ncbi:hypothetical protein EV652_113148 [Kribbella steppae]|uniref:DUF2231 domain-containing protein n=1 Tax=Kribbella steppae TaxID=2512223 RepID=A0A4R2H3D6_9ACTN|nr:DUF2231 domain-containing protein [Kribbella steppae]TCO19749.1 hypothetical protein EV652_113148 [Kribbella steppae]